MTDMRITYAPSSSATQEAEMSALINVYRFVLDCRAKKEAVPDRRPEDEKERSKNDSLAYTNYTE